MFSGVGRGRRHLLDDALDFCVQLGKLASGGTDVGPAQSVDFLLPFVGGLGMARDGFDIEAFAGVIELGARVNAVRYRASCFCSVKSFHSCCARRRGDIAALLGDGRASDSNGGRIVAEANASGGGSDGGV